MIPATTIIRSKKRKRTVALHVEADGSLTVTAPLRTSLSWINAFLIEKAGWIARRRAAWLARHAAPAPELKDGCLVPFLGRDYRVILKPSQSSTNKGLHLSFRPVERAAPDPREPESHLFSGEEETTWDSRFATKAAPRNDSGKAWVADHAALLTSTVLPLAPHLPPDILQAEIKTELTLWYKKQARRVFAERLAFWAALIGVTPKRLIITAPRARWGSCSAKNDIRLNWRLIMASPEIVDYVIVHELCHIPHKNHGKKFWALVEKFTPNAKKIRQDLRKFEKYPIHALFS